MINITLSQTFDTSDHLLTSLDRIEKSNKGQFNSIRWQKSCGLLYVPLKIWFSKNIYMYI